MLRLKGTAQSGHDYIVLSTFCAVDRRPVVPSQNHLVEGAVEHCKNVVSNAQRAIGRHTSAGVNIAHKCSPGR